MRKNEDDLKSLIPEQYHQLLGGNLIDTDTMEDKYRIDELHLSSFNKCEKCGYDLLMPEAYQEYKTIDDKYPKNGWVKYYHYHKLILCDKCVDELNGHKWE